MSQINSQEHDTERLLRRVTEGDQQAVNDLMERYRDRVRQMVKLRLDPRLAVRVDHDAQSAVAGCDRGTVAPLRRWVRPRKISRLASIAELKV